MHIIVHWQKKYCFETWRSAGRRQMPGDSKHGTAERVVADARGKLRQPGGLRCLRLVQFGEARGGRPGGGVLSGQAALPGRGQDGTELPQYPPQGQALAQPGITHLPGAGFQRRIGCLRNQPVSRAGNGGEVCGGADECGDELVPAGKAGIKVAGFGKVTDGRGGLFTHSAMAAAARSPLRMRAISPGSALVEWTTWAE